MEASRLLEAIIFPLGLNTTDMTGLLWPSRISRFVTWPALSIEIGGRLDRSLTGIGDAIGADGGGEVDVGIGVGLDVGEELQLTNRINHRTKSQDRFFISHFQITAWATVEYCDQIVILPVLYR